MYITEYYVTIKHDVDAYLTDKDVHDILTSKKKVIRLYACCIPFNVWHSVEGIWCQVNIGDSILSPLQVIARGGAGRGRDGRL